MIRALLFDLDDTLYDESDYVASGFSAVAENLAQRCASKPDDIYHCLQDILQRDGRGKVFDTALETLGIKSTKPLIDQLIMHYREHQPDINLFAEVNPMLKRLSRDYQLAIVTDGTPLMQRRKIEALELEQVFGSIIYCWAHQAPKPDPKGFSLALEALGCTPAESVVIGDRPDHDLAAAEALGCAAIRICRGRYKTVTSQPYSVIAELPDLNTLPEIIKGYGQ